MKKSKKSIVPAEKTATVPEVKKPYEMPLIRNSIKFHNVFSNSPGSVYEKSEKLIKKHKSGEELTSEELTVLGDCVAGVNMFESHKLLMNIPGKGRENDQTSIAEFAEDLIREYNCETTLEKSLCEMISASFYGYMRGANNLQVMYGIEYLSNEKNGYYTMISKETEKQSRLYLHTLSMLKALKAPQENISIRAKNAFIAQNQQFNNQSTPLGENQ